MRAAQRIGLKRILYDNLADLFCNRSRDPGNDYFFKCLYIYLEDVDAPVLTKYSSKLFVGIHAIDIQPLPGVAADASIPARRLPPELHAPIPLPYCHRIQLIASRKFDKIFLKSKYILR